MERPMYEVRIALEKTHICDFCEMTVNVTPIHNWHKDLELIFVTKGNGYINYDTKNIPMDKGDILVVNPNAMHRTYCQGDNTVTYHFLIIYESFCEEVGIDISDYVFEEKIKNEKVWDIYLQILDITNQRETMEKEIYTLTLRRLLTEILIELLGKHRTKGISENGTTPPLWEHIKKSIKYINENFMKPITLDDIANYSSVCKYHLSKEFKKYTGQTIFEYVNTVRCKNANTFISNGMSISEAAYRCGFENMSYFSKTFQKYVGVLPSKVKCDAKSGQIR